MGGCGDGPSRPQCPDGLRPGSGGVQSTNRCISLRSLDTVALQSRQHRSLTRYFPEIAEAVAELGIDVVLDGELVCWNEGRIDFAALQRRLHPSHTRAQQLAAATPAAYVTGARTGSLFA
jgi:hypothetical protein